MEPGANTTYVRYQLVRAARPLTLTLRALVNHCDYHSTACGEGWTMSVEPVEGGLRVQAYEGAAPVLLLAPRAEATVEHTWYHGFALERERERGLDAHCDHLHAGTFRATLRAGETLTCLASTEAAPARDGEAAWARRQAYEADLLGRWTQGWSGAATAPAWVRQLALGADQFVARRPLPDEAGGMPGRAAGQFAAVDEDDVDLVIAGEVIGGGAADDAAPDDNDVAHARRASGPAAC